MGSNPVDKNADWAASQRRQAAMEKRLADAEAARRQANAPETIAATGKHHRRNGR